MDLFRLSIDASLEHLRSRSKGLSTSEVEKRTDAFGANEIVASEKKNYIKAYLKQYVQFFAILLEVASVLSFVADHYIPNEGSNILGYAIAAAVFINASFAFWQEYKADQAMEALLKLMPTLVRVRRQEIIKTIDAKELVPGDIILLEEGDSIAADARLITNNALYINTATLNGESIPSKRSLDESEAQRAIEAKNMVFAGTSVASGSGEAVVVATAYATEFGKIAALTKNVQKTLTPMQKEIVRITRVLTIIAVIMGIIFFALGLFSDRGTLMASIFALSLIVANVPEGLMPTITLSLSLASQRMARRNALVKNLDSVQTLGSATVICTDKTGTLTKNEMTLKEIYLSGGESIAITGEGYQPKGQFIFEKDHHECKGRLNELLLSALLNSRASIEGSEPYGDPTELALVVAATKAGVSSQNCDKIEEIPFSSDRKMMSTYCQVKNEERLFIKGAPEVIFKAATHYVNAQGETLIFDDESKKRLEKQAELFEEKAYRTLALAKNNQFSEEGLTLLGLTAIMDLPRPEVKDAIRACKHAGIRIMMITGDNPKTAQAIATQIEMPFDAVLTGDDVTALSEERLEDRLRHETILFARMASNQKLKIATALQNIGEVVAMTGDGVNDAPALKRADIGIAMGKTGTDVAKEAADMILLDDNFQSIVAAIEEGRTVYFNIKKFVTYILSSNVPEIVPYILQFFLKIPLPLSVIQILSIDLGSDMLPGLALGSEKPEKNIMKRPPVGKDEKILDWEVFKRGYFFIGLIEASAAMTAFIMFLLMHGWEYGTVDLNDPLLHSQAMTMTLLGAVSCQLMNIWTMRSWEFSAFSMSWKRNKLLLWAMFLEFLWIWMLLGYEPIQKIFHTAAIPFSELWILLPFPIFLFISHEYYKYFKYRRKL